MLLQLMYFLGREKIVLFKIICTCLSNTEATKKAAIIFQIFFIFLLIVCEAGNFQRWLPENRTVTSIFAGG